MYTAYGLICAIASKRDLNNRTFISYLHSPFSISSCFHYCTTSIKFLQTNMNAIGISTTIAVRMRNRLPISRYCHHIFPTISKTRTLLFSSTTSENGDKECDNDDSSSIISGTISSQQKPKQGQKAKYLLPKRIILLRHGESLGNIDDTAYATIPDWKIPMTRR